MAFFRHMGKKRHEYIMSICVHSGEQITTPTPTGSKDKDKHLLKNGTPVSVQCKRGNKVYSTRMAVIEHSSVHWDEVLTFPMTVYGKEENSNKNMTWDKKIYQFTIRTDGKSDTRLSCRIDLAEYIHTTTTTPITKFFTLTDDDTIISSHISTPQKSSRPINADNVSSPSTTTSTTSSAMLPPTTTNGTPVLKLTIQAKLGSKHHPSLTSPQSNSSTQPIHSSPKLQTHSINTFTDVDENGTESSQSSSKPPISPKNHEEPASPHKSTPTIVITTSSQSSRSQQVPSSKPHQLHQHHPRNSNELLLPLDGRETRSVSEAFDRVMIKPTSPTEPSTATLIPKSTSPTDLIQQQSEIAAFEAEIQAQRKQQKSSSRNRESMDFSSGFNSLLGVDIERSRFSVAMVDDHIKSHSHPTSTSHSPTSMTFNTSTTISSALSSPTASTFSVSTSSEHDPISTCTPTPTSIHDTTTRRSVLIPSHGTLPLTKKKERRGFSRFYAPGQKMSFTEAAAEEAEKETRARGDTFNIHQTW